MKVQATTRSAEARFQVTDSSDEGTTMCRSQVHFRYVEPHPPREIEWTQSHLASRLVATRAVEPVARPKVTGRPSPRSATVSGSRCPAAESVQAGPTRMPHSNTWLSGWDITATETRIAEAEGVDHIDKPIAIDICGMLQCFPGDAKDRGFRARPAEPDRLVVQRRRIEASSLRTATGIGSHVNLH